MSNKKIEDETIISALLATNTRREASALLEIKEHTLYARMSKPAFKKKYQAVKDDLIKSVADRLRAEMLEAVDIISQVMKDPGTPPQIKINASDTIIRHALKINEQREIIERIEALEAIYQNNEGVNT